MLSAKGEQGGQGPLLDFEIFSKKGCFLSFEWEKTNFTSFSLSLEKFWKNHPVPPSPEKIFPAPMPAAMDNAQSF